MTDTNIETPRPPFKVDGFATIKHLNVRKEGPEDDKILAVDIKMERKGIDRRLCDYFDEALEEFLWRGDTDALIVRNAFMEPVKYALTIFGATAEIEGSMFYGCEVGKFAIRPRDGGVIDLVFSVTAYPSSDEVAMLAKRVQDDVLVDIQSAPDLFDSAGTDTTATGFENMAREDGVTFSVEDAEGNTLVQFGQGEDPMIEQAYTVVVANNKASISLVQRHLKVGYNRAARLIEELEKRGVVSPMNSSGARTVLKAAQQ